MRRLKSLMLKTFGLPLCAAMLCASGCGAPEAASEELGQERSELAVKKVMPLGDSITQGAAGHASYRCQLWQKLKAGGYSADFVGSMTSGYSGANTCAVTGFDLNHEGHWGWRADQVLAQISTWAAAAQPDIVLLHLGTNDVLQGQSFDQRIPTLAASKSTAASPVIVVEQWAGFNGQTDTYDGIHPNATGEAKMAERWYQAIRTSL